MSQLLDNVVGELSKLPGVGRRTALRLALHLLKQQKEDVSLLSGAIYDFRHKVKHCTRCNNISDEGLCPICSDARRDRQMVCIVEHVGDLLSIEMTGQYSGLYHVLGGVISPLNGVAPSDLQLDLLESRIEQDQVREIILALPTTIEGETTAYYLSKRLSKLGVEISAISRGIGFGDEIEYADALTISHALKNRKPL
ncbi:MAG: recombination mediator RecR [Rikenellaceae bacterium]